MLSLQPSVPPLAQIARICMGRVVDLGVTDANNMGAAMAPEDDNIGPCSERNMADVSMEASIHIEIPVHECCNYTRW